MCVFDSGKFDMFVTCLVNNVWCTNLYDDETAFLVCKKKKKEEKKTPSSYEYIS